MRQLRMRSMDDIGIGIPAAMPQPADPVLIDEAVEHAAVTRGEGLRLARRETAKDRNATLRVVLTLLKVLVIPRTEEFLAASAVKSQKIECKAGCNACCHQGVEVSIPEAILVALQVANPEDPRQSAILKTAATTADVSPKERILARIPCPLLVEGQCSVYDNRPLLCRATLSPYAKGCYDALEGKPGAQIYVTAQLVAQADKDALRGICKDLGLQHGNVELVQTVAAILRDPTTVTRWAAGEPVFKTVQPLSPISIEMKPVSHA